MPLIITSGFGLGGDDDSDSEEGSQPSRPSSPHEGSGESAGLSFSGGLNFDLSRPKSPGASFLQRPVATPKPAARSSPAPRPSPAPGPSPTPRPSARPSTVPRPIAQRLNPWQREFNYAVNKPFWRHLTTGETSWHPPPAAPLDWRSFCPCACESSQSCCYTCARLTLGLLVDLAAGFVTFRLNQVNGPRVPLGAGWQNGVEVRLDGSWPEPNVVSDPAAWQAAIQQPLRVPKGLCSSPPLGPNPEWDPESDSDE